MSGGGRGRWLLLVVAGLAVVVVAVVAPLLSVLHTSAQPVGGAAYSGTHSGGGAVEFDVSGDGSTVQNFRIRDVVGDTCTQDEFNWPPDIPIIDDSFSDSLLGSTVTGSFPTVGEAQGTFRMYLPPEGPIPACESEILTWTGRSSGTPTPTPTTTPGCDPGIDVDGDDFDGDVECYVGTDPLDGCPDDGTDDAWPLDMNMDTYITVVGDVLVYRGNVGKDVATYPEVQRLDLNMDGYVTVVGDVLVFRGMPGNSCT